MERKLASIQIIADLQPIEGADMIEVATVNSWKVVVKRGDFFKGDHAVFFEIDSFLPIREQYEFLRKSSFKRMEHAEGFRLKTNTEREGLVIRSHDRKISFKVISNKFLLKNDE